VDPLFFTVTKERPVFARIDVVHGGDKELLVELEFLIELDKKLIHAIHELHEDRRACLVFKKPLVSVT